MLLLNGAIISLANAHNKGCCDLADEAGFKALADALELSLLYQPEDESIREFASLQALHALAPVPAVLLLDALTLSFEGMQRFIRTSIEEVQEILTIDANIAEAILDGNDWNIAMIRSLVMEGRVDTLYDNAHLDPPSAGRNTKDGLQLLSNADEEEEIKGDKGDLIQKNEGASNGYIGELCSICSEEMSFPQEGNKEVMTNDGHIRVAASCQHAFCFTCWQVYYNLEVAEGRGEVIRCPGKDGHQLCV